MLPQNHTAVVPDVIGTLKILTLMAYLLIAKQWPQSSKWHLVKYRSLGDLKLLVIVKLVQILLFPSIVPRENEGKPKKVSINYN